MRAVHNLIYRVCFGCRAYITGYVQINVESYLRSEHEKITVMKDAISATSVIQPTPIWLDKPWCAFFWRCRSSVPAQLFFLLFSRRLHPNKQNKAYLPEPPFPHDELIQLGRLSVFSDVSGKVYDYRRENYLAFENRI